MDFDILYTYFIQIPSWKIPVRMAAVKPDQKSSMISVAQLKSKYLRTRQEEDIIHKCILDH